VIRAALFLVSAMASTGCSSTLGVGGAYFPAWLVCMVTGLMGSILVRAFFIRIGLDARLRPRALAYPSMALLLTLLTFLIFFR